MLFIFNGYFLQKNETEPVPVPPVVDESDQMDIDILGTSTKAYTVNKKGKMTARKVH